MAIQVVTNRPYQQTARVSTPARHPFLIDRDPHRLRVPPPPRTQPAVRTPPGEPPADPPPPPEHDSTDPLERTDRSVWNQHGLMGHPIQIDRAFYLMLFRGEGNPLEVGKFDQRLIFQVNPDTIAFPRTRATATYDLLNGPQAMQVGQLQLKTYSWSSFFPAEYDPDWCLGRWLERSPRECMNWIEASMERKSPLTFICQPVPAPQFVAPGAEATPAQMMLSGTGVKPVENMSCFVTSFIPSYRAGEPLDVYYDIELTEHRDVVIKRVGPVQVPKAKVKHKFWKRTTKKGDTLIRIARLCYGPDWANPGWKWIEDYNQQLVVVINGRYSRPTKLRGTDGKLNPGPNEALKVGQSVFCPKPKPSFAGHPR